MIISKISKEADTNDVESQIIEMLNHIALESYSKNSTVNFFASVEMMLLASFCEIRTRGFRGVGSITKDVLSRISNLVVFELIMEAAGKRNFQTFPPYNITNEVRISGIFAEIAENIKPPPEDRPYSNPFHELEDAASDFVQHYRSIADQFLFKGLLLEKWIIVSINECIDVCLRILEHPPENTDLHLDGIEEKLCWFIGIPPFFFIEGENFAFDHAEEACSRLAAVGLNLIKVNRLDPALACGRAIRSFAKAVVFSNSTRIQRNVHSYVSCVTNLEVLARTAEVFDLTTEASTLRSYITPPDGVLQEKRASLSEQLAGVHAYIDRELRAERRLLELEPNPIVMLRQLLQERKRAADGNPPP